MAPSSSFLATGAVCALATVLVAAEANADWLTPRHDPQRTGTGGGSSNIVTPGAYWRLYLGGRLAVSQGMPVTVGGAPAFAYVASGNAVVTRPNGVPLWTSGNRAILAIVGLEDLDGDQRRDLIVQTERHVLVFDVETGNLLWAEDEDELGALGAVRVADIDGDGLADVLVEATGCARLPARDTGYVYSFANGFDSPRRIWRLPLSFCGGRNSLVVDDIDGDSDPDVLLGDWADFKLLDGATGELIATSPELGIWIGLSTCQSAELDGAPGADLLCVHGTALENAGAGHRVFAVGYRVDPGRLELLWSRDIGERDGTIGIGAGFLHDLDGDGSLEAVVTGTLASGVPETVVLDAHTGEPLAAIAGETIVGVATPTAGPVVLTQRGNDLVEWSFQGGATPLVRNWSLSGRRAMVTRDWTLAARQPLSNRILTGDVDGDGEPDVYTINTKLPSEMPVHALSSPVGQLVGRYLAATGSDVLAGWPGDDGRVSVSTSDGRVTALSPTLDVLTSLRAGGYYADGSWANLASEPVAGDLDGDGIAEVLITDSRRTLLAVDARSATNAGPPSLRWEAIRSTAPSIVPQLGPNGGTGVAFRRVEPDAIPPVEVVGVAGAAGEVIWETPIGTTIYNDILPGDFDGDLLPDLVVQWGRADDTAIRTTALAGNDGRELWTTVTQAGEVRFPAGAAVIDWNGDGVDDVVFHHYGTRVLSGVDGAQIAFGGSTAPYFMPMLADVAADARPEVTLHGGLHPVRTLTDDLAGVVWASSDDDRPYPYAASATCESGPVVVSASLAHSSRLKVTLQAGVPGAWRSVVLADGALFADEDAAVAAGVSITNQLTSVYVHADLTGQGRPSAVVGSTDGWLYAVDPCSMTLDFSMPFEAAVGAVAFADTDGDGLDELLVSTADGFLRGVKHAPISAPGEVLDVEPTGGDVDIDEIVTRGMLAASWDPVEGAIGYEVTVAHAEGGSIAEPAWQRVDSTFVVFSDLPLEDGSRYVVSVRALSDAGPSPDTLSDGVLVHVAPEPPDAGPSGDDDPVEGQPGGCCSTGRGNAAGSLVLALVVALVGLRRHRRA